jgi:hypothetical protein
MPETSSYGKRFGNTTAAPRSSRPPGTSSSGNRGVIAASWAGQNGQVAALPRPSRQSRGRRRLEREMADARRLAGERVIAHLGLDLREREALARVVQARELLLGAEVDHRSGALLAAAQLRTTTATPTTASTNPARASRPSVSPKRKRDRRGHRRHQVEELATLVAAPRRMSSVRRIARSRARAPATRGRARTRRSSAQARARTRARRARAPARPRRTG